MVVDMNNGFIVIWRKFLDTSFFTDSYAVHLAITLLMKANHRDKKFTFNNEEIEIKRGQCIVGRKALSLETGIHTSTIYRKLMLLQEVGFLNIKTNNKFSIITICNYSNYQDVKDRNEQQVEQPANNQRTTSEHKQQCNNDNNETIKESPLWGAYSVKTQETLKTVFKKGLNIYALLNRFHKERPAYEIPDELINRILTAYLKNTEKIENEWAWFLTVLKREGEKYFVAKQDAEHEKLKQDKGVSVLADILKNIK